MKLALEKIKISPDNFMRTCGYVKIENPHKNNETSYAKSFEAGRFYPRFHVYLSELSDKKIEVSLHLDMKKPSYEGVSAHSGEYDGELVQKEILRIQELAKKLISTNLLSQSIGFSEEKSFWQKILSRFKK